MVSLPDGEEIFEDMFIRFDVIHKHDRRTDGRTDTALQHRPRLRAVKMTITGKVKTIK